MATIGPVAPRILSALLVVLLASACGARPGESAALQLRDGRAGVQLSGTVDGRQIVVSDGLPRLVVNDCDPQVGDDDVCVITRTIDGRLFVIAFENPAVLETGASLPVGDPACGDERTCDEVTDVALVDVQLDTGERVRATGGRVDVRVVEPLLRYAVDVTLTLPDGRLSGDLDVVPQPR